MCWNASNKMCARFSNIFFSRTKPLLVAEHSRAENSMVRVSLWANRVRRTKLRWYACNNTMNIYTARGSKNKQRFLGQTFRVTALFALIVLKKHTECKHWSIKRQKLFILTSKDKTPCVLTLHTLYVYFPHAQELTNWSRWIPISQLWLRNGIDVVRIYDWVAII